MKEEIKQSVNIQATQGTIPNTQSKKELITPKTSTILPILVKYLYLIIFY